MISELAKATEIRTETEESANTAERVGSLLENIVTDLSTQETTLTAQTATVEAQATTLQELKNALDGLPSHFNMVEWSGETVEDVTTQQSSTYIYEKIVYDTVKKTFLALSNGSYYTSWANVTEFQNVASGALAANTFYKGEDGSVWVATSESELERLVEPAATETEISAAATEAAEAAIKEERANKLKIFSGGTAEISDSGSGQLEKVWVAAGITGGLTINLHDEVITEIATKMMEDGEAMRVIDLELQGIIGTTATLKVITGEGSTTNDNRDNSTGLYIKQVTDSGNPRGSNYYWHDGDEENWSFTISNFVHSRKIAIIPGAAAVYVYFFLNETLQ